PLPIYVTGGFGYRFRNEPLHDEMFFNAEAGLTMGEALIKVSLDGLQNTSTPPDIYGQTVQLPLPGGGGEVPIRLFGDQDFTKLNAGII
ncbi:MAG: hypothetical protein GWO38_09335, partial [Phycisphaerae bacterium]|nr:hypothetical protein [Phycisphaerae bacterium]NIW46591.1 hypothetical protein [Gammaproteobacteria bacterium]NIW98124.1 hypothetical protein [Phycisphaerae bacterium]NIX27818.1 hypothetical protein [Phycisphaerae bacterium]